MNCNIILDKILGLNFMISYDIMINPGDIHMNGYHDSVYVNEIIL